MEVLDSLLCVFELVRGLPSIFFGRSFVTGPPDFVYKLTPVTSVHTGINDFFDFVFFFIFNDYWRRRRLLSTWNGIFVGRLEL